MDPAECWTGAAALWSGVGVTGATGAAVAAAGDMLGCALLCVAARPLANCSVGAFSPPPPAPARACAFFGSAASAFVCWKSDGVDGLALDDPALAAAGLDEPLEGEAPPVDGAPPPPPMLGALGVLGFMGRAVEGGVG